MSEETPRTEHESPPIRIKFVRAETVWEYGRLHPIPGKPGEAFVVLNPQALGLAEAGGLVTK